MPDRSGSPHESGGRRTSGPLTVEGTVLEALPHDMFAVGLDNGTRVLGHISGDLRTYFIRVVPGDRVTLELSPRDLSRGRITARHK